MLFKLVVWNVGDFDDAIGFSGGGLFNILLINLGFLFGSIFNFLVGGLLLEFVFDIMIDVGIYDCCIRCRLVMFFEAFWRVKEIVIGLVLEILIVTIVVCAVVGVVIVCIGCVVIGWFWVWTETGVISFFGFIREAKLCGLEVLLEVVFLFLFRNLFM